MGVSPLPPAERFPVRAGFALRKQAGRVEYLRGRLQRGADGLSVTLAGAQGSGVLRSMSEADCFVVLPEECTAVQAGDTVSVQPFHGLV
jgi:molybdopterin molybdotransferase